MSLFDLVVIAMLRFFLGEICKFIGSRTELARLCYFFKGDSSKVPDHLRTYYSIYCDCLLIAKGHVCECL